MKKGPPGRHRMEQTCSEGADTGNHMLDRSTLKTRRQPVVGYLPPEETLLFRFRKGMDRWETSLRAAKLDLHDTLRELVWELLVECCEFVESELEEPQRDAYRLASDVGRRLAERMDRREAVFYFRDVLLNSIIQEIGEWQAAVPSAMTFFMAVGDAIWEAFAERLRSSIRQEKRQRLTEQLRIAKRIQQHLLPKSIPEIAGFDFAGRLRPAEEVGGDYWSVKNQEQEGLVTMKLADVTGHGIGAATLVAAVKFISGGYYRGASSAAEVMERTNSVLVRETPNDILVTMIYGWLYPGSREVRLVNAGHHPVFIAREDGFNDIHPTGPVMGLHECEYTEHSEVLNPGDILVFTSDGVTEAGADRPFGTDRLKQVVWDNRRRTAGEIADAVIDAVQSYDVAPSDDLSVVVTKSLEI